MPLAEVLRSTAAARPALRWLPLIILVALLALALLGCATPEPRTVYVPQRVDVPVPVPCVDAVPPAPAQRIDVLRARGTWTPAEAVAAALADLETALSDGRELRAALNACLKPAP